MLLLVIIIVIVTVNLPYNRKALPASTHRGRSMAAADRCAWCLGPPSWSTDLRGQIPKALDVARRRHFAANVWGSECAGPGSLQKTRTEDTRGLEMGDEVSIRILTGSGRWRWKSSHWTRPSNLHWSFACHVNAGSLWVQTLATVTGGSAWAFCVKKEFALCTGVVQAIQRLNLRLQVCNSASFTCDVHFLDLFGTRVSLKKNVARYWSRWTACSSATRPDRWRILKPRLGEGWRWRRCLAASWWPTSPRQRCHRGILGKGRRYSFRSHLGFVDACHLNEYRW